MRVIRLIGFAAVLILPTIGLSQSKDKPQMLIGPDQLLKELKSKNLRVVDSRSANEYSKGHIPGAVRVDVGAWKTLATAKRGLHDKKGWSQKVGALGIGNKTRVVVYGSSLASTARIWWLLKYVGVRDVAILNGSYQLWSDKRGPTQKEAVRIQPVAFEPKFQTDRLAEIDSVKKSLKSKSVKFVDTRSDREFNGGRIPGSAHLNWTDLLEKDGRLKTTKQLQALFKQRGINPSETAVCY